MIVRVKDVLNIYVLKLLGPVVKINDIWKSYTANHSQDASVLPQENAEASSLWFVWEVATLNTWRVCTSSITPPQKKQNKTCHLKRNHLNRKIVFQPSFFRGYVSFSEEYQVIPPWIVIKIIAKTSSSSFAKSHSFVARWRLPTLRCQILRTFFLRRFYNNGDKFGWFELQRSSVRSVRTCFFSPPAHKEDFWHGSVSAWFWLIDILFSSGVVGCDPQMPAN